MLRGIGTVQVQPKKQGQDHADYTTSTGQHELDHSDEESICPERSRSYKQKSTICSMCAVLSPRTYLLAGVGCNRLNVDEAARVVQRRALNLVSPLESCARLEDTYGAFSSVWRSSSVSLLEPGIESSTSSAGIRGPSLRMLAWSCANGQNEETSRRKRASGEKYIE